MLRDWIYRRGKLATSRSVIIDGGLEVAGLITSPSLVGALPRADTGFVTAGNITVGTAFTALGSDLTISAAVGDVLELNPDFLVSNTGSDAVVEAATRVSGANANYWSSGTSTSRFPGCLGNWYIPTGTFTGPRGAARYTVQAGDVVGGQVTVRLYGRVEAGSRVVFANATFPLRWTLTNIRS